MQSAKPAEVHGINRNIVECKVIQNTVWCIFLKVLIETLWNVKKAAEKKTADLTGINRNIVECKDL